MTAPLPSPTTIAKANTSDGAGSVRRASKRKTSARARSGTASPVRRLHRGHGFMVEVEGVGELGCTLVRGFREAALASVDPRAAAPARLVLIEPERALCTWLFSFAEDIEQVRRTLTIYRRFDGKAIRAVVTLSSFGYGVETALAVESVSAPRGTGDEEEIFRSGVHSKADIKAALARYDAELRAARESLSSPRAGEAQGSEARKSDFD